MAVAPVLVRIGVRKIDDATRLQRGPGRLAPVVHDRPAVSRGSLRSPSRPQEIGANKGHAHRDHGVFPDADPEIQRVQPVQHPLWGRDSAPGSNCEAERVRLSCQAWPSRTMTSARNLTRAELARGAEHLVGVVVEGAREPSPEAPARRPGRPASEPGVALEDHAGRSPAIRNRSSASSSTSRT